MSLTIRVLSVNVIYGIELELKNITPESAKAIRKNLNIAFIYKLEEPYFTIVTDSHEPTRDKPEDITDSHHTLHAISKEIWVFNKTTGEILLKVKAEDGETEG